MKIKFKKKHAALILSALVILFVAVTFAFYTSTDAVTNRFSGENHPEEEKDVKIVVNETFDPPPDKDPVPFQKKVQIQNTGTMDCYIRVRLEFSSSEIRDISWISNDPDKDNTDAYIKASEFPYSTLPAGWEYRAYDGFYYYKPPVPPEGSTVPLIQWVKTVFPTDSSVDADGYDIFVYSEAVPAVDANGERLTYDDAWR